MADRAAAFFYERLFVLDPASRTLFRGNFVPQGPALISMLTPVVDSLDHIDTLLPKVRSFGARQSHYGIIEEHYATVGAALMWALKKCLGPEFTPTVANAWTSIYSRLALELIEGQRAGRTALAA
jgi:hemoglobin-like flavoprotein